MVLCRTPCGGVDLCRDISRVASHALPLTVPYDLVPTMSALYPDWCRVSRRYLRRSLLPQLSDPKPYMMEAPRERMRYAQVGAARTVRFVGA